VLTLKHRKRNFNNNNNNNESNYSNNIDNVNLCNNAGVSSLLDKTINNIDSDITRLSSLTTNSISMYLVFIYFYINYIITFAFR